MKFLLGRLCVTIIIIVIIISCLLVIIPLSVVINEPNELKSHFNNKYINNDYQGWEKKTIPNYDELMLPEIWGVSCQGNIINVTDSNCSVIARGIVLENSDDFDENPEYLTALCGANDQLIISKDFYEGRQTMMGSSDYRIVNISSKNQNYSYITARIKSNNTDRILWLSFALSKEYDDETVRSWVEAIIYAHEYMK